MIEVPEKELEELIDWMVVKCEDCDGPPPRSTCMECPVDRWKDKLSTACL